MAVKVIDITNYSPKSLDVFFFDNSVWMYLFCPLGSYNKNKQKYYSAFLQSIKTSRSTIFISSLVLSEFANRYLRMDFERWKDETNNFTADFKNDFVGTQRYNDTIIEIKRNINQIMQFCEKSSDNFNAIELNSVFQHLSEIDFNDSYYIELAKLGNWKIVTDDNDFIKCTGHNLEIITLSN
ncbi:MAG: type II toxin-antitoxin system VapC family toxin [Bacteroidales bacterium]|nr:type II toxin-antitoxin system VapC family toxin [Bacteroidales bacterium]